MSKLMMLGPPAAGKGTQAQMLAEKLGIPQISTGDMLRAATAAGTEMGKEAARYMSAGKLVPDEVVVGIVKERLESPDVADGLILDGFPRTLAQAEALAATGIELDAVITIEVPDEMLVERVTGRRSCGNCKAMYHIAFNAPTTAGVCDNCGGDLSQRSDDNAEAFKTRLSEYYAKTAPLVGFYEGRGKVRKVDGVGGIDDVQSRVLAVLPKS